ncbi:hypothetical protein [Lacticaseibacillus brantae]|uniref:Uncharacterized protein n=1 Tax=Lacticaseibacillus brantae DSM 23927 TaxID=1423727 RepID=A0A0R2B8P6_9LACO|nr:hypothetical protein [Lacticaseibacillus brantae]KRM71939.1 hypothetical protein FC34_GL000919 [Lacticaseibacillus brantae DSM 23927]
MRQQRRHHRSTLIIILSLIGLAIILIGAFLLIRRAPDVSGPSVSSSSSATAKKASFDTGTYAASGSVTDSTDNLRQLSVWIKLSKNKSYTRLLIYDRDSTPMVINDHGTFTKSGDELNLKSEEANVYAYANPTAYSDKTPNSITNYVADADSQSDSTTAGYPDAISDVLNNKISLDDRAPDNYYYLESRLPMKSSSFDVKSLADFAEGQEKTPKLSESSSPFTSSSETTTGTSSTSSSSASSGFVPTAAMIQIARQQLRDIGKDDKQWSDAQISAAIIESANRGGDSVVPILVPGYSSSSSSSNNNANVGTGKIKYVDQAYAILLQKYPASQYSAEQSGMTSDGSGFIFNVRNRQTGESMSVTITGDGAIQG